MKEVKTVNKATPRQKRAMELFLFYLERQQKQGIAPPAFGEIMVQAGYSQSMRKQPAKVMNSPAWQEFLNEMDDTQILQKWREWALDDDPSLRGYALKAGENIMKLKDRYPTQKTQNAHIHAELKDLME